MNMNLLEANARFTEYFGCEAERGENSLYKRNIKDNMESITRQRENILEWKAASFHYACEEPRGPDALAAG